MILWQIFPLSFLLLVLFLLISITQGANGSLILGDFFVLNSFGLVLSVIPIFSLVSLIVLFNNNLSLLNSILIVISGVSSVICFNCNSVILFFINYELSIILLLFSLFTGSPYSERNLAGWYFLGYLVFGGIPLLLCCIYTMINTNTFIGLSYSYSINHLLFLIFITKVPLFPFHSWLPIVHAEANSYVSIMLSGYIMKLGLLGIIRFFTLSGDSLKLYVFIFFVASCYFFITCFLELDNKRWLAFLSLGHISVGMVGLFSIPQSEDFLLGSFSLGHALSVIFLFLFFNMQASSTGSRNWIVLINNNNNSMICLLVIGVLSLIAFPPSILFINELFIFVSNFNSQTVIVIFCLYIFLSVLGPICVLSLFLSRLNYTSNFNIDNIIIIILLCSMFIFNLYFIII
uniref:NADH-ubiquinone oxidoreductase chain 4 n=1 Tax=Gyrodactylus gurleyi TaxID=83195 RepID=A0A1C7A7J0_9PLAT|nr:NADH dehydrogenase subunit 4 [Gyrodactylus gurleyi]AMZ79741.1 NADH dehydrogenase subunit 4 [Gyrodactylus gurleyi]